MTTMVDSAEVRRCQIVDCALWGLGGQADDS